MVIWVPGNHELWTRRRDPVQLRGERPLPVPGRDVPAARRRSRPRTRTRCGTARAARSAIAPLFLLYDYSFLPDGRTTSEDGLALRLPDAGSSAPTRTCCTPTRSRAGEDWCRRAGRGDRGAAGGAAAGPAGHPGQPLPAGARADPGAALSRVRAVVRHDPDRGLAPAVPRSPLPSTVTCTSREPPGTTASGSRRSRSATRGSGAGGRPAGDPAADPAGAGILTRPGTGQLPADMLVIDDGSQRT